MHNKLFNNQDDQGKSPKGLKHSYVGNGWKWYQPTWTERVVFILGWHYCTPCPHTWNPPHIDRNDYIHNRNFGGADCHQIWNDSAVRPVLFPSNTIGTAKNTAGATETWSAPAKFMGHLQWVIKLINFEILSRSTSGVFLCAHRDVDMTFRHLYGCRWITWTKWVCMVGFHNIYNRYIHTYRT